MTQQTAAGPKVLKNWYGRSKMPTEEALLCPRGAHAPSLAYEAFSNRQTLDLDSGLRNNSSFITLNHFHDRSISKVISRGHSIEMPIEKNVS